MYSNYAYLSHHGILGQHWGKKNGPPYPLGPGDHSASERKAGWRKSLDKDGPESDSEQKLKKKGLSDKQKKALKIGAAVVGATALAAGATYVAHKADVKLTNEMRDYYGEQAKIALAKKFDNEWKAKEYNREAGLGERASKRYKEWAAKKDYKNKSLPESYNKNAEEWKVKSEQYRKLENKHKNLAADYEILRRHYRDKQYKDRYDWSDKAEYKRDIKFDRKHNKKK